jgi:hypothetical protein
VVSELANTTFEIPSFTAASITLYVLSAFTRGHRQIVSITAWAVVSPAMRSRIAA